MLKLDQSPAQLDQVYRSDYYHYLNSPSFQEVFLKPLGKMIDDLDQPCLDVGCGEGWLADYVTVPYMGIEGSAVALERARARAHPRTVSFFLDRIEKPVVKGQFGTIVFGNVLWYSVNSEMFVPFLEQYLRYQPTHFIIYDLEPLDTLAIDKRFRLTGSFRASVELPDKPDIYKHRKILVYSCR